MVCVPADRDIPSARLAQNVLLQYDHQSRDSVKCFCAPSVFSRRTVKTLEVPSLRTVSSHVICGHILIWVSISEIATPGSVIVPVASTLKEKETYLTQAVSVILQRGVHAGISHECPDHAFAAFQDIKRHKQPPQNGQ